VNRLLFVCGANVCRSPYLAYLLEQSIRSGKVEGEWLVQSRGVWAAPGARLCPLVSRRIESLPFGSQFATAHRSRSFDADVALDFDMILTASTAERSAIAKLCPQARPWTFTALEASLLSEADATGARSVANPDVSRLRSHALELHSRRGRLEGPGGMMRTGASSQLALDIADGHVQSGWRHRRALRDIVEVMARLSTQLARCNV